MKIECVPKMRIIGIELTADMSLAELAAMLSQFSVIATEYKRAKRDFQRLYPELHRFMLALAEERTAIVHEMGTDVMHAFLNGAPQDAQEEDAFDPDEDL